MLPENRTRTNIGVAVGTLLQIVAFFLAQSYGIRPVIGLAIFLVSIPIFIWGCMNYAEGKGHSKWTGLVGLSGLIGLIVLVILPDQQPQAPPDRQQGGSANRPQTRKLVGLVLMLLGLLLVVSGRYFDDLDYSSIWSGRNVPIEPPWPCILMFSGVCLIIAALVLMLIGGGSKDG